MTTLAQQLEQLEQDVLNYMKVTAASGQSMREAIDRFAAIRAAVGGEAVAWMLRRKRDDFVRGCYATKPTAESMEFAELDGDYYTPLYASTPATVDVGALRKLVKKWNGIPANNDIEFDSREFIAGYDKALNACADELAALIGEEA